MIEPREWIQTASDGYSSHVLTWSPIGDVVGRVVVLHGVQSHGGWYHSLGRILAEAGFEATFPDRRGSGKNMGDRGHAGSAGRLVKDLVELLELLKGQDANKSHARLPLALAGISWGGKLAVLAAAKRPDLVDALALICPGLHPRVGVPTKEKLAVAWARLTNPHRLFNIPLADPALFTDSTEWQAFIRDDPLSLRTATASLMASSALIDLRVRRARGKISQPLLLMLAGRDRIVDNDKTIAFISTFPSKDKKVVAYPEAHHTLEFEPDPGVYVRDLIGWLKTRPSPASES